MSTTPSAEPVAENSHKKTSSSPGSFKSSRWATLAALMIAVIAVAVAIAAWFHTAHTAATPTFTSDQVSQAKANVCSGYATVRKGVLINTHLNSPNPNDPAGQLAVAANARLALLGGGGYLQDLLLAEPAAPAELAKAIKSMGNTMEQLGSAYLADGGSIVLDPLRRNLDAAIDQVSELCK
jgi:hypothetical protein